MPKERILVIKLGALGDFIYSIGPMQAIKKNHPDSELTLMTRPAFEQLGQRINTVSYTHLTLPTNREV